MICNNCGKEHSLIYPEYVNTRLRKKMICISCEKWIDLIDEIQVNPEHIVIDGIYTILIEKEYSEVKDGNYFSFLNKTFNKIILSNDLIFVGRVPEIFKGFFPNNAEAICMEN